jgi:hypothetical protein
MTAKFNSIIILALLLMALVEVCHAIPKKKGSKDATASSPAITVSSTLKSVVICDNNEPPTDPSTYLQQSQYYGGARSTLVADNLFDQGFGWGLDYTIISYDPSTTAQDFTPGISEHFAKVWPDGAYALAFSCHKDAVGTVDNLNEQCNGTCGKTYSLALIWGTYAGMNYDKDHVLIATCSAIEITNSDDCFDNFPSGCQINAVGDTFSIWDSTIKRIAVNVKSKAAILAAIKAYSSSISIPSP